MVSQSHYFASITRTMLYWVREKKENYWAISSSHSPPGDVARIRAGSGWAGSFLEHLSVVSTMWYQPKNVK